MNIGERKAPTSTGNGRNSTGREEKRKGKPQDSLIKRDAFSGLPNTTGRNARPPIRDVKEGVLNDQASCTSEGGGNKGCRGQARPPEFRHRGGGKGALLGGRTRHTLLASGQPSTSCGRRDTSNVKKKEKERGGRYQSSNAGGRVQRRKRGKTEVKSISH